MNALSLVRFPLLVALCFALLPASVNAQTLPDQPVVKGSFLGDGKEGNIQHLSVQTREPFSDQPAIRLIFTEKDPAKSKKPDFDAGFKKLGSALLISVFKDGGIFGCEVAHTAHEKSPFTALGQIQMKDFKVTETHVSGQLVTPGELDAFGQKWNVDLTFSAPLSKGAFAALHKSSTETPTKKMEEKEAPTESPSVTTSTQLPVEKLPLPSSAVDVEYKKIVEHLLFRSDDSVSAVAKDFSARLKAQGWKEGPGSLVGKTNAILKRKLDGAELTIMIQPAGSGCTVKVFTQGLDWSHAPDSNSDSAATTTTKSSTPDANVKDIKDQAKRLLNEALKQTPSSF